MTAGVEIWKGNGAYINLNTEKREGKSLELYERNVCLPSTPLAISSS
jgi:hypothetical protein